MGARGSGSLDLAAMQVRLAGAHELSPSALLLIGGAFPFGRGGCSSE
jgi:hypothetical protein